jgi:lysophospholipase L1-like esterase
MTYQRILPRVLGSLLAVSIGSASAFAASNQSKTIRPADGNHSGTVTYTAFGDSIAAGYCGIFCQTARPYGVVFSEYVADAFDVQVDYRGRANSGFVASQIYNDINAGRGDLSASSFVSVEACGNDFLNARSSFNGASGCDTRVLDDALADCLQYVPLIYDRLLQYSPSSNVRIYGMAPYYPGIDADRADRKPACGGQSNFDILLPYIAEGNYHACQQAWARGIQCVDAFSAFHVSDANRATLALVPGESLNEYRARILANKHLIVDANRKPLPSGGAADYIINDNIHPTYSNTARSTEARGHNRLGLEQYLFGFGWTTK